MIYIAKMVGFHTNVKLPDVKLQQFTNLKRSAIVGYLLLHSSDIATWGRNMIYSDVDLDSPSISIAYPILYAYKSFIYTLW